MTFSSKIGIEPDCLPAGNQSIGAAGYESRSEAGPYTIYTLLEMTKDRGLAMVDLQRLQVFDPRGRADVEVATANGARLPYLTEQLVRDVMADQDFYGDYVIVKRAQDNFIQSLYKRGEPCHVEYRAGDPDHHFQIVTTDRTLVPPLIWAWIQAGPDALLLQAQHWCRVAL